jgi:hypothetical protein
MLNLKRITFLAPSVLVIVKFSLHDYDYDYVIDHVINVVIDYIIDAITHLCSKVESVLKIPFRTATLKLYRRVNAHPKVYF